jgi:hypothetical protein
MEQGFSFDEIRFFRIGFKPDPMDNGGLEIGLRQE